MYKHRIGCRLELEAATFATFVGSFYIIYILYLLMSIAIVSLLVVLAAAIVPGELCKPDVEL